MELKRYEPYGYCEICDAEVKSGMEEDPCGNYLRRTDAESQMIPRPDEGDARNAVETLERTILQLKSVMRDVGTNPDEKGNLILTEAKNKMDQARAILLRLMGVE